MEDGGWRRVKLAARLQRGQFLAGSGWIGWIEALKRGQFLAGSDMVCQGTVSTVGPGQDPCRMH